MKNLKIQLAKVSEKTIINLAIVATITSYVVSILLIISI